MLPEDPPLPEPPEEDEVDDDEPEDEAAADEDDPPPLLPPEDDGPPSPPPVDPSSEPAPKPGSPFEPLHATAAAAPSTTTPRSRDTETFLIAQSSARHARPRAYRSHDEQASGPAPAKTCRPVRFCRCRCSITAQLELSLPGGFTRCAASRSRQSGRSETSPRRPGRSRGEPRAVRRGISRRGRARRRSRCAGRARGARRQTGLRGCT